MRSRFCVRRGWIALVGLLAVFCLQVASLNAEDAVSLNGAGATFPHPLYQQWFADYMKAHPAVTFNYQAVGSGKGIQKMTDGEVDFGGTDGPMSDEQLAAAKEKRGCKILHLPSALGAVVPTYNIEGVTAELNFTAAALSGIFLGTIKKWNDKAIADANPDVKLPDVEIVVVHRQDGSGTTYCFTDYLSKVSAAWKDKVGKGTAVTWPTGRGAKGNDGVAGLVQASPNSIGYVELIYALQNKMSYGKVQNVAGKFIKADLGATAAAAAGAATDMPADFRVSITNAPGEKTYPIATFTWLMIPDKTPDAAKRKALVEFLTWAVTSGQEVNETLQYGHVPKEVVDMELKVIKTLSE